MKDKITNFITDFVRSYKSRAGTVTDWKDPLVGFADANDPLFAELRTHAGKDHHLPTELLSEAATVISYYIPFTESIALSNEKGRFSSFEWAKAYVETNMLISDISHCLSEQLNKLDVGSFLIAPTHNFDSVSVVSDWSHKHVAFIAGLGRFGLHRMLITGEGCCGRLGSMITTLQITPSTRPEDEFCLYYKDGSCRECVGKCVFGALKTDSFDRFKCYEICRDNEKVHIDHGSADVCGKCISVVPCSFKKPV
jgi:epoxyqueuosine reductase QueG